MMIGGNEPASAQLMQIIYRAENSIDANLLKGLLEQHGIMAFVNGEFLQGGIGELPASGLVTVSVNESDVAEARAIAEKLESDLRAQTRDETRWDPSDQLLDWKG
jgi:hypothetical protein